MHCIEDCRLPTADNQECVNPSASWWYCRVTRVDKKCFRMYKERTRFEPERFLLSARMIGDDFYISSVISHCVVCCLRKEGIGSLTGASQYESFPDAQTDGVVPSGRYGAVMRRVVSGTVSCGLESIVPDRIPFYLWACSCCCGSHCVDD